MYGLGLQPDQKVLKTEVFCRICQLVDFFTSEFGSEQTCCACQARTISHNDDENICGTVKHINALLGIPMMKIF